MSSFTVILCETIYYGESRLFCSGPMVKAFGMSFHRKCLFCSLYEGCEPISLFSPCRAWKKRKVKSVFLSHLESMGWEWTPAISINHLAEDRKSFNWRWKIVWLRTENHLAQTFFVAFSKERGLSAGRGSLFPGVIVSYGKHIHPHHLFVDRINDTVLRIDAARPVSGQVIF